MAVERLPTMTEKLMNRSGVKAKEFLINDLILHLIIGSGFYFILFLYVYFVFSNLK